MSGEDDGTENLNEALSLENREQVLDLESQIKKLATIANSSADAMMSVDLEGRFEFWNTGAEALFGYKGEEIIGDNFHKFVPTELREEAEVKRRLALKKGSVRFETIRLKKDGTRVPVDMTLTAIPDENGNPTGIAGSIKDLTEKEKVESELRETKNHLESIFDTILEAICVIDRDLRIISFNEAFAQNTNTPRGRILGKKCYEVLHGYSDDEYDRVCTEKCIVIKAFESGEPTESVHHHELDGEIMYHESKALPTKNDDNETGQVVYIINDVTEKKRAEEALCFLAEIQDQVSEIILTLDSDQKVLTVNPAGVKAFGYKKGEIIGKNISILVPDDQLENASEFWEKILRDGYIEVHEGVRVAKSGKRIHLEMSGVLVQGADGLSSYVIGVARDITERKKAENALKKYASDLERSNKLKDLFADIMSHDLLNPLGVVRNVFDLIEDGVKSQDMERELSMVHRNIRRVEELVQSAARFGQVESAEDLDFEMRDLGDIIRHAVQDLETAAAEKDMKVAGPIENYLAEVNVFIEDVFSNLISNAIKYGPQNTEITISVEDLRESWKISVADNGMGVPDDHKKDIFERFKRVGKGSVKGSGLGLAIVKKVVELHKGEVWVEDNLGGGSIFTCTVPKKRKANV
jgi:PAS domain S-box-containing protein